MILSCQFGWDACSQSNAWLHPDEFGTANQLSELQILFLDWWAPGQLSWWDTQTLSKLTYQCREPSTELQMFSSLIWVGYSLLMFLLPKKTTLEHSHSCLCSRLISPSKQHTGTSVHFYRLENIFHFLIKLLHLKLFVSLGAVQKKDAVLLQLLAEWCLNYKWLDFY